MDWVYFSIIVAMTVISFIMGFLFSANLQEDLFYEKVGESIIFKVKEKLIRIKVEEV